MHIDANFGDIIQSFLAFVFCGIALWGIKKYNDVEKTFEKTEEKQPLKQILFTLLAIFCIFGNMQAQANTVQDLASNSFVQTTPYDKDSLKASIDNILGQYLPGAKLLDLTEVKTNGKSLYNCKVLYKNTVTNLVIDPSTGKVKGNFKSEDGAFDAPNMAANSASVRVSTKQVNDILSKTLPGAKVTRTHYDKKDGTVEGFINYRSTRFYFKINAQTGEIITMQPVGG